jgi:Tfp pilus assembly protein PilV
MTVRRQSGDTIIEVLIALTVIAGVIGISYASASRSSNLGQQAQERAQGLLFVQQQIEYLRTKAPDLAIPSENIFVANRQFCLVSNTSQQIIIQTTTAQCTIGADGRYTMSVNYTPDTLPAGGSSLDRGRFTVRASWERLGGGQDQVTMVYRLNPIQFRQ